MKIIAKTPVQLGGHIYERGEECEYGGVVTARIAANFTDETGRALEVGDAAKAARSEKGEGAPHSEKDEEPGGGAQGELFDANDVQARIDKTIQVLGRQGIMQALEDMGITYQANASNKHLAKLLLTSQGEIKAEE
jgi:hypothetical protein